MVLLADGGGDQLRLDAEAAQPALDPLGAPAVEPPPVVGEAAGEARVVEVALLAQLADDGVDHRRLDAAARERAGEVGHRVLAAVEGVPGDVAGVLEAHLGVE